MAIRAPSVEDVARLAGVSRQTVSNVLNAPEKVKAQTAKRVNDAIQELGYRPHASARRLRTRRSATVGVHLDPYSGGISGALLDRFIHSVTEIAGQRAVRVLVHAASSPAEEMQQITELFDSGEIDGVIISGTHHGDARIKSLQEKEIPFASFGRAWSPMNQADDNFRWVDVDGAAGTRLATQHAVDVGYRNIGFLGWPSPSGTGDDRCRGWRDVMEDKQLRGPILTASDSVGQARAVIDEALRKSPELDAIICASDSLAIGAHLAAIGAGKPGMLITGFDNTPAAEALGLSSIEQGPEKVARAALNLLFGQQGNTVVPNPLKAAGQQILLAPELIVRNPIINGTPSG